MIRICRNKIVLLVIVLLCAVLTMIAMRRNYFRSREYLAKLKEYSAGDVFRLSDIITSDWDTVYTYADYGGASAAAKEWGVDMNGMDMDHNDERDISFIMACEDKCIEVYTFHQTDIDFEPDWFSISRTNDEMVCQGANEFGELVFEVRAPRTSGRP